MFRIVFYVSLAVLAVAVTGCGDRSQNEEIAAGDRTPASVVPPKFAPADWPWWRGPDGNNVATSGQSYPTQWTATENVRWRADVPGRGLSSPTIVGDRVLLTTADESRKLQSVLCYDRSTGDLKWRKDVHQGGLGKLGHDHNSFASSTIACDGERVFAAFENAGGIHITALDLDGKFLWQTKAGAYSSTWGFGSSPVIHKELVIIAADGEKSGFLAALHRSTGKIWWRKNRDASDNYASPTLLRIAGKDQLILSGGKHIRSYDPMTGNEFWNVEALTDTTCGTLAFSGDMIFGSGGYSGVGTSRQTAGIKVRADSATVAWTDDRLKVYVTSLLAYNGCVYGTEGSILHCLDAASGKENWKTRIPGETYGSPVFAGGHIYLPTRNGKVVVFKPNASRFERVAVNSLGDEMDTTPTPAGGNLFLRVADRASNGRQESLYCIGLKSSPGGDR